MNGIQIPRMNRPPRKSFFSLTFVIITFNYPEKTIARHGSRLQLTENFSFTTYSPPPNCTHPTAVQPLSLLLGRLKAIFPWKTFILLACFLFSVYLHQIFQIKNWYKVENILFRCSLRSISPQSRISYSSRGEKFLAFYCISASTLANS